MTPDQLRKRLTTFAVDVVNLCDPLWQQRNTAYLADQLCRAATGAASNYRVASRARSRAEFISKLSIALEEADESIGWLEILLGTRKGHLEQLKPLIEEGEQLVAILSSSKSTAIARRAEGLQRERDARPYRNP